MDLERDAAAGLIMFCWSNTEHDGGTENVGKALSLEGTLSKGCRPIAPLIDVHLDLFSGFKATPPVL